MQIITHVLKREDGSNNHKYTLRTILNICTEERNYSKFRKAPLSIRNVSIQYDLPNNLT